VLKIWELWGQVCQDGAAWAALFRLLGCSESASYPFLYIVLLLMLHVVLSELLLLIRELDTFRAQVVQVIYSESISD